MVFGTDAVIVSVVVAVAVERDFLLFNEYKPNLTYLNKPFRNFLKSFAFPWRG